MQNGQNGCRHLRTVVVKLTLDYCEINQFKTDRPISRIRVSPIIHRFCTYVCICRASCRVPLLSDVNIFSD